MRVVRRAGGKPPEDLRLFAAPSEMWIEVPEPALPSWPVPKDGRLAIPLDSKRPWRLRVAGRGEGSWWVDLRPGQRSTLLTSSPASDVEITVLDPAGKPVGGGLTASLQEAAARGGHARGWATLHGEGARLAAPGLPDEAEISLTILNGVAAPMVLRGRPSALPHQVRLAAGAELAGRLVDPTGAPVAGVPVEAESWSASDLPQLFAVKSRSGPNGEWRLRGLPSGRVAWSARAPGFVPLTDKVDVQAGARTDLGTRSLEPGTTLAVRVIDDAGTPLPAAQVQVAAAGSVATAEADGVARLSGLPAAPLELKGTAAGHLAGGARFNPPFPQDAQLILPRAFTIVGRFVDSSQAPALRGTVRVDAKSCQRDEPLGEGGRFRLDLPPELQAAELVLRSPATGELRVRLPPGQAGEVRDLGDLQAAAGLAVSGRVVRADARAPRAQPSPGRRAIFSRRSRTRTAGSSSPGSSPCRRSCASRRRALRGASSLSPSTARRTIPRSTSERSRSRRGRPSTCASAVAARRPRGR